MCYPRRLISFATKWNGSEIGRVRLDEEPVSRNQAEQIVVRPFPESDDAAEGDVPAGVEREPGERVRSRIAVQDSLYTQRARCTDHGSGVVLGISRMHNQRQFEFRRELDLALKDGSLSFPRRIVVMVVESALSDRDSLGGKAFTQLGEIASGVETRGIMRMDTGSGEHELRIRGRAVGGQPGCRQGFTDADDGRGARIAGAGDYLAAVAGERRVREVGVAVDEDRRLSVLRGHFRSIQRSTGDAT